ncbi:MAG: acyl carrier protein [Bacteroidota bacterium]
MEISGFITNFAAQFDDTDPAEFFPGKKFREIKEWSSLIALSLIAMVEEEYNVDVKGDDIRTSETIEDLYTIVKSRM